MKTKNVPNKGMLSGVLAGGPVLRQGPYESEGGQWVEVTGPYQSLHNLKIAVHGQYRSISSSGCLRVLVPSNKSTEYQLLQSEQRNLSHINIDRPPASVESPCGQHVLASSGLGRHTGSCKACRVIQGLPQKKNPAINSVLDVPEMAGSAMNLDALLECMATTRDEALGVAAQLDSALASVKTMPALAAELATITAKVASYQQALSHFIGNGEWGVAYKVPAVISQVVQKEGE